MWYVVQVHTGQEMSVAGHLADQAGITTLVPRENRLIRKGGDWQRKTYTLIPGYVFCEIEFCAESYYKVTGSPGVIRFLRSGGEIPPLTYLEAEWIKALCGPCGQPLEPSHVERAEDGRYLPVSGPLLTLAGQVIKYDAHARRATVEVTICGAPKHARLSIIID